MTRLSDASYSDSRFGVVQRAFTAPQTKDDVATVGTLVEAFINLPTKSKIVEFGLMSAASDCVFAANDTFELRTNNGTKLATLVFAGNVTLGSGEATSAPPETATTINSNRGMICAVGSTAGTSGSVIFFVDYTESYVASV